MSEFWRKAWGVPYREHGLEISSGLSCWGFVRWCFQEDQGITLPEDIFHAVKFFKPTDTPKQGCVIHLHLPAVFNRHVGYCLDDRWFLQCSAYTNGVAKSERTRTPWAEANKGFFEYIK